MIRYDQQPTQIGLIPLHPEETGNGGYFFTKKFS